MTAVADSSTIPISLTAVGSNSDREPRGGDDAAAYSSWWKKVAHNGEASNPGPTADEQEFLKAAKYQGTKQGFFFGTGAQGAGYYTDKRGQAVDLHAAL